MTYETLVVTLLLGSYVFTSGAYIWIWNIYKILTNHQSSRITKLEKRVDKLENSARE